MYFVSLGLSVKDLAYLLVAIGSTHFITHSFYCGDNYTKFAAVAVRRVKINDAFLARYIAPGTKRGGGLPNDNKYTATGYRKKRNHQISLVTFIFNLYYKHKLC